MRHISTLIAGVIVTPLSWLLLAYGEDRSAQAVADAQAHTGSGTTDFVRPVVCLAAAGLLLGILTTLRISPLGAMLTGVAYAAAYVTLMVAPARVLDLFPHSVSLAGHSVDPATPLRTGTALVIGALLLVATFSAARWRGKQTPKEPEKAMTDEWVTDENEPAVEAAPEFATRYTSVPGVPGNGLPNASQRHDGAGPGEPNRPAVGWPTGYGPGPAGNAPRRL